MPGQTDLVLLRHAFPHIGVHSGYENFIPALKQEKISCIEVQRTRSLQRFDFRRRMLYTRTNKKKAGRIGAYYDVFSYIAEMDALRAVQSGGAKVLHNTHLEDNHGYLGAYKSKHAFSLIATAHQPVSWWKYTGKDVSALQQLDVLLALDTNSASFFEQYIPGRVQLVYHAVDNIFFSVTKPIIERPFRILFVGSWLRDLQFLETVLTIVLNRSEEIIVDLLYRKSFNLDNPIFRLCKHPRITLHHNISDEQLRILYNETRLLFVPFIDATANNALLEAAACGVPIITTGLSSIKEYTHSSYTYYYSSENDCVDYIISTMFDEIDLSMQSNCASDSIKQFSVNNSAKNHSTIYRKFI